MSSPTPAETEILEVLWGRGRATVREVHSALEARRGTGYTTVLKLMQIMAHKGLLIRDESRRSHVYAPAIAREQVQRSMLGELVDRAFAGSVADLVMHAVRAKPATQEELDEIRELLARIESREADGSREQSS